MPSLTIIGGTVLDCLSKVKDLSCPCTQVLDYSESIGGMAYNTSLCTTQLGVETRLVSAVGADFPKLPLYKGLDLDFARLPEKSARCMLFFDEKSERIFFFRGCYHDIDTDRAKAAISRSDWVHFAGIAPCFAELAEFAELLFFHPPILFIPAARHSSIPKGFIHPEANHPCRRQSSYSSLPKAVIYQPIFQWTSPRALYLKI